MAAVLPFSFSSISSPFLPLLLSLPQAQNTQQTGFKGNLRLLVKTLEQPHLPFKILPAALSHCLHLFWSTDACCFHCLPFYPPRIPGEGGHMCWGYISLSHTYSHLKKDLRNRVRGSECLSLYLYTYTTTGERCLRYVWLTCGHVAYHAGLSVTTDSAALEKSTCQSLSSPLLCSGCSAASFSLPLRNHESPSLTHTQRPAVSLHLFPTQRSTPLCLHLHPPYFCHHIQTIKKKKSSAAFDFLPFSSSTCYLSVLCALSLYRCRDPTKALHFTTI